jgi:hypothetical protein
MGANVARDKATCSSAASVPISSHSQYRSVVVESCKLLTPPTETARPAYELRVRGDVLQSRERSGVSSINFSLKQHKSVPLYGHVVQARQVTRQVTMSLFYRRLQPKSSTSCVMLWGGTPTLSFFLQ